MAEVELTDQNFNSEVLEVKDKPVLVDFWAEWCTPCKMQAPILEEVAKELGDKVKIAKLEVDLNPQTAQNYQVLSIPTIIVFKGGEKVWQAVGVQQKETLVKELSSHLS